MKLVPKDVQLEVADALTGPWRSVKSFQVQAKVPNEWVVFLGREGGWEGQLPVADVENPPDIYFLLTFMATLYVFHGLLFS